MIEQFSLDLVMPDAGVTNSGLVQLWTPNEIYDRLDQDNLNQFMEDRRFERKSINVQARTLGEYLSMWSNTQPHGGLIIVGLENNGTVTGCLSNSVSHRNDLESLSTFCPDARWACKNVPLKNHKGEDDFVMLYRVMYRPDKLVETSGGEAFIREGDKKIKITEALKREIRIAKGEIHYELERANLKYPDDFDRDEVRNFCRAFFNNRRFQTAKRAAELLELARLGKIIEGVFYPNLACALLFAKDSREVVPGCRIRVIRYEGLKEEFGEKMNSVFSTFVDGNIPTLLRDIKPIVSSQIRTFQRYNSTGKIRLKPEYPEEAWFEAIVNAVAHRSYNLKTQNIFVKIFDDRLVVESPGGFVPPTTGETVYDAHNPRNPYLMEAMMHLELTFCGFEGTRRMRQAMKTAKLPEPKFRQIEAHSHQVHVTLENDITDRRTFSDNKLLEFIDRATFSTLSNDERLILEYLSTKPEINITHAAILIKKSWPTTNKAISSLVEKELVELVSTSARKRDSNKSYKIRTKDSGTKLEG